MKKTKKPIRIIASIEVEGLKEMEEKILRLIALYDEMRKLTRELDESKINFKF